MKKPIFMMILLLCAAVSSFSQVQNYNKQWVQGGTVSFKTDFTASGPVSQFLDTTGLFQMDYCHSDICDGGGNLLIFTDGGNIYHPDKTIIDNGDTLMSNIGYYLLGNQTTQTSIILPLGDSIYQVVCGTWSDTGAIHVLDGDFNLCPGYDQVRYHTVDMKENNYQGKVTQKSRIAMDGVVTSYDDMTAVRHGNGHDWWVVRNGVDFDADSQTLYTFWVQQDTVLGPFVQTFLYPATGFPNSASGGQATFSHDGKTYISCAWGYSDYINMADFDRCAGVFSNHQRVPIQHALIQGIPSIDTVPTGVCFSPNDSLLYVSTASGILQWELYNPDSATAWEIVGGLDTTVAGFEEYINLYEGHDGKIYIGNFYNFSSSMSRIDNPNVKGLGCNFCPKCLDFPIATSIGAGNGCCVTQPPNMPNYTLGPHPNCYTSVSQQSKEEGRSVLYPNPADASLTISYPRSGRFQLVDMLGRVALTASLSLSQPKLTLGTTSLPPGVYSYRFTEGGKYVAGGKVVIKH